MDTAQAVAAFSALAHAHRLSAYRLLVERGPEGLSAGAIAEQLGLPPSSLTFHLQHLHRAGLITQQRVSRQIIYAADFAQINDVVGFLTDNCCGGNPAVCLPDAAAPTACKPSRRSGGCS